MSFITRTIRHINRQVKEDKMGRACSTHTGRSVINIRFWQESSNHSNQAKKGSFVSLISRTKVICKAQKISTKEIKKIRHDLTLNEYTQKFVEYIIKLSKNNRPSSSSIFYLYKYKCYVRMLGPRNLRKFLTDCLEILTQRFIRIQDFFNITFIQM